MQTAFVVLFFTMFGVAVHVLFSLQESGSSSTAGRRRLHKITVGDGEEFLSSAERAEQEMANSEAKEKSFMGYNLQLAASETARLPCLALPSYAFHCDVEVFGR